MQRRSTKTQYPIRTTMRTILWCRDQLIRPPPHSPSSCYLQYYLHYPSIHLIADSTGTHTLTPALLPLVDENRLMQRINETTTPAPSTSSSILSVLDSRETLRTLFLNHYHLIKETIRVGGYLCIRSSIINALHCEKHNYFLRPRTINSPEKIIMRVIKVSAMQTNVARNKSSIIR